MANIDASYMAKFHSDPGAYNGTAIGTAAGTTVLATQPAFLSHINVTSRVASGNFILYDSNGTSTAILGTYVIGTSTTFDPPTTIMFKWRTNTGLTIANSANVGIQAFWLP